MDATHEPSPFPARADLKIDLTRRSGPAPKIAWDRPEHEACQASTPGCSIDHLPGTHWGCETW